MTEQTSPFRTGSSVRYQVEVTDIGGWMNTSESIDEIMNGLRVLCADLIEGIDQENARGETNHLSLYVEPASVGEAVRRINEAGYSTDEDAETEADSEDQRAWQAIGELQASLEDEECD